MTNLLSPFVPALLLAPVAIVAAFMGHALVTGTAMIWDMGWRHRLPLLVLYLGLTYAVGRSLIEARTVLHLVSEQRATELAAVGQCR